MVLLVLVLLHSVLVVVLVGEIQQASSLTDGFCSRGYLRDFGLVRDELHLAWKVDEIRRQQQGAETKSCSQVGQFRTAFKAEYTGSHKNIYILLDLMPI